MQVRGKVPAESGFTTRRTRVLPSNPANLLLLGFFPSPDQAGVRVPMGEGNLDPFCETALLHLG